MLQISGRRPDRSPVPSSSISRSPRCLLQLAIIASLFVSQDAVLAQVIGNASPSFWNQEKELLLVKEDTPIGTSIYSLTASDTDGDSLTFSTNSIDTRRYCDLGEPRDGPLDSKVVDVFLKAELDRDFSGVQSINFTFRVTDQWGKEDELNVILEITDVNDVAPLFVNLPYEVTIKEDTAPGGVIYSGVSARDPDFGRGVVYSMQPNTQAPDEEYRTTFKINYNGHITLERALDYEKHSYYQFLLGAEDEAGQAADPVNFVVYVLDVQDSPPMFINLPYSIQIDEDTPLGQPIQRIVALDGDKGIPNNITYSLQSGDRDNFNIDPETGDITIATELDRDSDVMRDKGGVYAMTVMAAEVVPPGQTNTGATTATTLVTITVRDVNDNGPRFSQDSYNATILENMQTGVPVNFQGPIMHVSDIDQGSNSHFHLSVQKDGIPFYDFAPQPQDIYSESSVIIRVNNTEQLDYEGNKTIVFKVIAREIDTLEKRSSTATLTINIEDMNDNAPSFIQPQLVLNVSESTRLNTVVATYTAADGDSGTFGTVQYSIRGGNGRFRMNSSSGELSVMGELDREENPTYYLTVEAKDGGGLRTPVEVTVHILDANDNKPVFRRNDYESILREGADDFTRPVIVEASDDDEANTPNSLVSYRLVKAPPGLDSNFTVDASTGELSLTQPVDYEKLDPDLKGKLTLVVEAYDAGVPEQSSEVMINITVEDANDFTPEFTSADYTTSIPENSLEGFVVETVSAVDLDGTSPNNDLIYRIESGAVDKFRIDFKSGEVLVEKGAELDREARSEYTLTLSAIDRGTPPRTGYSTLKITLTDVNDESPEFIPPSRTVTVNENTQINSPVLLFSAVDRDLNPSLSYSLGEVTAFNFDDPENLLDVDATGIKDYFGVNTSSGQVFVKSSLDRETTDRVILAIVVEDTNADVGQQTATGTLAVTIQDYNDEAPRFLPTDHYSVAVSEADSVQSIVLQVTATDDDFDQSIDFSIGKSPGDSFSISNDGTIRLKKELDREEEEQVEFEVIARDSGSPALVSTATVTVRVLDDNDNGPIFQAHQTRFEVSEDESAGFLVETFNATDLDSGDFGQIVYTLAGTDSDDGSFAINSTTGELTVSGPLDREKKASYSFEVVASDSPNDPDESKSTRSQRITITLLDVDDNPPRFTQLIPAEPFTVESSPVDQTIATVVAVDSDDPRSDNGRVIYSLTSDTNATLPNGSPLFKINSTSGIVATARTLRGYAGQYYITVMATNQARKFTPTRTINIAVRDVNDDVPRFIRPSSDNAIASVLENSDIGTSVFDLDAVDNDIGPNGEIRYSIVPLPNSDRDGSGKFSVDPITGLIQTTSADLNAESQAKYELKILATDQGYPDQYSTSLTMVVVILDKNDHKPEFEGFAAPHPLSMEENTPNACVSVDLAVDKDLNTTYTSICYYLIGSSLLDTFILNVKTGQLCLNKSLDRETTPYVDIVVQALEDCYRDDIVTEKIPPLGQGDLYPAMFLPTKPDRIWIEIKVLDLNDNPPKFKSKDLALGVTRVTQFGRFILDLKADVTDEDSSRWGVDKFVADSQFKAYPEGLQKELDELQVTQPFRLFPNGSVKTNMYFKPQMSGYFTVDLRVVDKGGLSDTAKLRISLINDDQRLIIVFRRSIDTVGPIKDQVASRLSAKVGYRIVVDTIQTHETKTGQADPAKTDMYIHGEDFETNQVIPAARLLSLIDQKNALLVDLLNDYNVVEMIPVNVDDLDDGLEDKLKMALILVAVVLGAACIILAVVLFYVHKRYERKLKAATAMAYEPNNPNVYVSDIPGANIHSYENANPIFMEKILLESREDGLNTRELGQTGNCVEKDNEEQEVILHISHPEVHPHHGIEGGAAGGQEPDGATLPVRFGMDQHQRYLEAVIGEHKVKVERGLKRREALVVDMDSDEDDDGNNDIVKGRHNVNGGYDDENDDDGDDDDDTNKEEEEEEDAIGNKYNDGDLHDILAGYGTSRRDSGIEEKSEHSGILYGKDKTPWSDPLSVAGGGGSSEFKGGVDENSRPEMNGLHPRLSYSSSSDTGNPPGKSERKVPKRIPSPAANGRSLGFERSTLPVDSSDKNLIKSVIENSGGVRVFPPAVGPNQLPFLNGNYKPEHQHHVTNHRGGNGPGDLPRDNESCREASRVPPDPQPRGSPPVRHVRTIKAPSPHSDFKNGIHTTPAELESFVELTDL